MIKDILQGHFNEIVGNNVSLKEKRLAICRACPIYKDSLGGVCNHALWLNPNTNEVRTSAAPGFFRGCGCRLQAKTTLPGSFCPARKW